MDWHAGRAESPPFADASFDLVVCQHGLQFTADKPAAVAEMRRVLAPGGVGGHVLVAKAWRGIRSTRRCTILCAHPQRMLWESSDSADIQDALSQLTVLQRALGVAGIANTLQQFDGADGLAKPCELQVGGTA